MAVIFSKKDQNRTITVGTGVPTHPGVAGDEYTDVSNGYQYIYTTAWTRLASSTDVTTAQTAAQVYADSLVVGLWDDRGNFDASVNAYPTSGGSGTAGAILKGDIWTVSVAGTLPTGQVVEQGDTVRALTDSPGNTQTNWAIGQTNIIAQNGATFVSKGVFYVSKKYTGTGNAVISGLTAADISSSNSSYTAQLSTATMGSMNNSYPCPWSARNAALDAIASSTIAKALIIVLDGDYTVGSTNAAQNGNNTGTPNSGVVTDIQFASTNTTSVASLPQNNLTFYCYENTSITYLNSAFNIYFCYQSDGTDTVWTSGFTTKGSVIQVYGQVNGWIAAFVLINNARAKINLSFENIILQEAHNFLFNNVENANLYVKNYLASEVEILQLTSSREGNGNTQEVNVIIDNLKSGIGYLPFPDYSGDFWVNFIFAQNTTNRKKIYNVTIGTAYIRCNMGSLGYLGGSASSNLNVNLNVKYNSLVQFDGGWSNTFLNTAGLIILTATGLHQNNNYNFYFNNAETETTLFGLLGTSAINAGSMNNNYNLYVVNHIKKINPVTTAPRCGQNVKIDGSPFATAGELMKVVIDGKYYNSETEVVSTESGYSYYGALVTFKGLYKTTAAGKHVASINQITDKGISFINTILLNDGSVSSINNNAPVNYLYASQRIANRSIYFKDVQTNAAIDSSIIQVGESVIVNSDIVNYL
jgi:hypothetical protein